MSFRYATKRKISTVSILILAAWIMALVISLPMYIEAPGFSNFHAMDEDSIRNITLGGCMPPVDYESRGFVLYSSILAFIIPSFILGGLQSSIMYRKHFLQGRRVERVKAEVKRFGTIEEVSQKFLSYIIGGS